MEDLTDRLTNKTSDQYKPCKSSDQGIALDLRYGEIGIPAVAAAAHYLCGAGNRDTRIL